MVGEIRDKETADIAIQASLTGHLVLSTVHTNDSVGAITRLIDMGVEPYLIASSLRMVIAQRLVRKIDPISQELSGRIGIFESILVNDNIKEQIHNKSSESEIKNIAFKDNNTLELDGQEKVNLGLTSEDELRRVLKRKLVMPNYSYKALDPTGITETGVLIAENLNEAQEELKTEDLFP